MRTANKFGASFVPLLLALGAGCASENPPSSPQQTGVVNQGGAGMVSGGPNTTVTQTGGSGSGSVGTGGALGVPCNVATVVSTNCSSCHGTVPQYGAPMALMTLDDFHKAARSNPARQVYQVIPDRLKAPQISARMPPSTAPALTATELSTFDSWLAAGATGSAQSCAITMQPLRTNSTGSGGASGGAAGMPANNGMAGSTGVTPTTGLGASDKPIEYNDPEMKCYEFKAHAQGSMTTPFAVDTTPDKYTNFLFMPAWKGMMYIRSMSAITGNSQVIHHWLFYKDSAAATDGSIEPSVGAHPDGTLLNGWAPGGSDLYLDPDIGQEMPGDVAYTLETHHNNATGTTANDASGIKVCVTPKVPKNIASLSWLGTDAISNTTSASGTCKPSSSETIHVLGGTPHMHTKGTRMSVEITRADGKKEMLHDQPFDFGNQHSYQNLTTINPGDSLKTTCYWNAPASFGEGTKDEMCYYFTLYYPKLSLTDGAFAGTLIHGPNTCLGN